MTSLSEIISLLPKYKDLSNIIKLINILGERINYLEQRIKKLEEEKEK